MGAATSASALTALLVRLGRSLVTGAAFRCDRRGPIPPKVVSPLDVFTDFRNCLAEGAGRVTALGGSLLDKMLENDMGSEVLVDLDSSLGLVRTWPCGSPRPGSRAAGRSAELLSRSAELALLSR